ncbi:hypothetical protein [Gilliamella sp. Bif1-4]|uniref:hypothetical protein n=2 Tax=Gilliamella sp. Bif1-4 TaxID=3120233 RepID=UPI00080ED7AC|nr:hypothetical protein [Gilliamella apicola]OCG40835.1 hypothetical protein A9G25_06755 [Gilliamella apicola]
MNLQKMAIDDFGLFKQNKIYEYEINKKLYNESYKKVFIDELKKEAVALIERGYSIDADQYPEDQISMIRRNSEVSITTNQKRVLEDAFNEKYPLGITDEKIVSSAIADFERFKNNKVTNFEIALKIERNDEYKQLMQTLFKKEAKDLNNKRGYNFDVEKYSIDKINDILLQKKYIPESHLKYLQEEFNQKFEKDFPSLNANAKADFELLKQNKIPDVVIANKLINDTSYKETMISLFEKSGDDLVKNGQSIPDVNSYALQKINNIIDNASKLSEEEKINSIKEYEQKNNISAEYLVKTFEDNKVVTKNINAIFIQDILSIESGSNLLSVERVDLKDNLYPFLTENKKLIFAQSIEHATVENVIPLNQNDAINYYQNMLNEKNNEFNEFSKKMSSFLDNDNKNNQIRFENAHYLINELDKNPEKFSQFSSSFIEKGISENVLPDSNIKVGENIKEALKDKVNPPLTFVETVKKKVIKETKLLIDIVDNTKKILLEKPLKSIQDKLFNKAMDDAEKKLEHQQNNQKSSQREKSKNAQVSL